MTDLTESYDLYLYNDDINTELFIIQSLLQITDYPVGLSVRLMKEAQKKGKVLIDTDSKDNIVEKRDVLISLGLNVQICKSEHHELV